MGYNFIPSEISAAFAIEQLKKLKKNIEIRIKNFKFLYNFFKEYTYLMKLPSQNLNSKTGWLAFPIVLRENNNIKRKNLQIYLEKNNIQTRTIFTGNILRQPMMRGQYYKKHKLATSISNNVMKNGILIGCHHCLNSKELRYICNTFDKYFNNVGN